MDTREPDSSRYHFARLSLQYYTMGRAAALYMQMPVLGNLFHHAVEMAIKAGLAEKFTLGQMKKLSHHLPKLWAKFQDLHPTRDGTPHTNTINQLHLFEELRYPDSIVNKGAMMQFAKFREHVTKAEFGDRPVVPAYLLVLEDVDALMAFIYEAASVNVSAYVSYQSPGIVGYLLPDNRHLKL